MKLKLTLILFILFAFLGSTVAGLKIVFRYDDFILKSDKINEEVVRIFQKNQIPLVLGVIPADFSEKFILEKEFRLLPLINEGVHNGSIEIALHGFTHQQILKGEFVGLNIIEQNRRITMGKIFLDSVFKTNIKTFIPPFNAYDSNTLSVLEKNNINILSSALCVGQSFSNKKLVYGPETLEDFNDLHFVLSKNKNRNGVIVVMFHDYTFKHHLSLCDLDKLLKYIHTLDYVNATTFRQINLNADKLDETRMKANLESNLLSKQLYLNGVIQTTRFANFIRIINLIIYLCLAITVYLLFSLVISKERKIPILNKYASILFLVLFVSIFVWFHLLAPLKLIPTTIFISVVSIYIAKFKMQI